MAYSNSTVAVARDKAPCISKGVNIDEEKFPVSFPNVSYQQFYQDTNYELLDNKPDADTLVNPTECFKDE